MDGKLDLIIRSRYPQPDRKEVKQREEQYYIRIADEAYQKLLKDVQRRKI